MNIAKQPFPQRVPEPKQMGKLELKEFEKLSKANYKRWVIPLIDIILKQKPVAEATVLDLACGPGVLTMALSNTFKKWKIIGIDRSPYALRLARKNCKKNKNTSFVLSRVEKLPFKKDSFDLVVCKDSFHEFKNPEKVVKEVIRVTKKRGIIYIQDLRRDLPDYLYQKISPPDTEIKKLQYYSYRASYTKAELKKMLQKLHIKKFIIHTQRISAKLKEAYSIKFGIDKFLLKEGLQSRYYLIIRNI